MPGCSGSSRISTPVHRTRLLKNSIHAFIDGKYGRLLIIAGVIVIADQISKAIVLSKMALYQSISVIPGFFSLTHIHNPGGAFGFLAQQDSFIRIGIFIFASSAAIILIFVLYRQIPKTHPVLSAGLALIFGGAIGNLIDRLRFGKVVDFLDFYIGAMHWPAFNVADSAITVGVAIFLVHLVFRKLPE
ncbi:MAG: signal peptidase II [Desulfobacterales bacterium]|nr:signal peptidase II [Desulfobacterales bacterium]